MNPSLPLGLSATLIICTVTLRALRTGISRQIELLKQFDVNQTFMTWREKKNPDRRYMIILSSVVIALSILWTPVPIGRNAWPNLLTALLGAGIIRYWLGQPPVILEIVARVRRHD